MKREVSVAVQMNSDLGSLLVGLNFLHSIRKLPGNADIRFELFLKAPSPAAEKVLTEIHGSAAAGTEKQFAKLERKNYAMLLDLDILPILVYGNWRVLRQTPELLRLGKLWQENEKNQYYTAFYRRNKVWSHPYLVRILIQHGVTFLNAPDLDGTLGIRNAYAITLPSEDIRGVIQKRFITVHTGQGGMPSTAQWTQEGMERLVSMLRAEYPQYEIVQLGLPGEKDSRLEGVDRFLAEPEAWEQIKCLLKNAALHVDYDSGMVHMRKALHGGPSVVLFGPTPPEFYGYGDDLAVRADACDVWCMQLTDRWDTVCQKTRGHAPCMTALSAQKVMACARKALSGEIPQISAEIPTQVPLCAYRSPEPEEIEAYVKQEDVYGYEEIVLPASELYVCAFRGQKVVRMPLSESPMLRYLQGDTAAYAKEIRARSGRKDCEQFTRKAFDDLIARMDSEEKKLTGCRVVADANHVIEGGAHQAAVWMHVFGPDAPICVTRVYKYEAVISEPEKAARPKEHKAL